MIQIQRFNSSPALEYCFSVKLRRPLLHRNAAMLARATVLMTRGST